MACVNDPKAKMVTSQVVYDGFVTFENGCNIDGPRLEATVSIDNNSKTITVTTKKPVSVFVAPGQY